MPLANLILLSNRLEKLTVTDLQQETQLKFDRMMHETDVQDTGVDVGIRDNLNELHYNLQRAFDNLENELERYKDEVQKLIDHEGVTWFQNSSASYERQLETRDAQRPDAAGLHRNKPIQLDDDTAIVLKGRVTFYSDWHYPAMIIHPMMETFIHEMLGSDPLYLVDESHYLLEPTLDIWKDNQVYRNRLRAHQIEESFDQPILEKLPNGQFGFCLVYNYLNYRPYEIIKKYLTELYEKLKPGGVVAITFNDCDQYQAMQMVEQYITCYTPGSLVYGWAEYLGFEKIFQYQQPGSASVWVEFKKPGELTSLRGGQALAKIIPK